MASMTVERKRIDPTMVEVVCHRCRETYQIPFTELQESRWTNGELIQRVAPELSKDNRELLISGTCGDCWNAMFEDLD